MRSGDCPKASGLANRRGWGKTRGEHSMQYRVYYFFERSGESVSSASAVEMSARDICEQLVDRFHGEDDYLGIIDSQENVLQILSDSKGERFWVELPMDGARASFGKHVDRSELGDLIRNLPRSFDREQIPGLRYKPW